MIGGAIRLTVRLATTTVLNRSGEKLHRITIGSRTGASSRTVGSILTKALTTRTSILKTSVTVYVGTPRDTKKVFIARGIPRTASIYAKTAAKLTTSTTEEEETRAPPKVL